MESKVYYAVFQSEFQEDLRYWVHVDRQVAEQIMTMVEAIVRDPTCSLGQPQLLNHLSPAVWARIITQEHRLVYLLGEQRIDFLQARYHQRR
ncbi:MAG: Txe/YoeB family addiction module toxin [Candidatus Viridilinea halotolerans]|uniref:Endoribonuclease YoeB n=1 Tax=Candidatus Viridilinea halotolerans TaxID=2491704 RepID=A0A426U3Q6_9CHLR|nr:MAG: Txe/YoeB family addiction module toxin [Candidatus Viridilinea halotolerans]